MFSKRFDTKVLLKIFLKVKISLILAIISQFALINYEQTMVNIDIATNDKDFRAYSY